MSRQASGLNAWFIQRVSAVYMAFFIIYVLGLFVVNPPAGHAEWHSWLANPAIAVATALFFLSLLIHAWVGVRDIFIDYIKPIGLKATLLVLLALGLIGCGVWVLKILLVVVI